MLLGGGACALAGLVAAELAGSDAVPAPRMPSLTQALSGPAAAFPSRTQAPPERLAAAVQARPLFAPNRRPPCPGETAPAPPCLSGTVVGGFGPRAAIILVPSGLGRPMVLQEGERAGRFTVVRIAPGQIHALIPAALRADRYARGVGGAAARQKRL